MNMAIDKHTWRNDRGLLEYYSLCDEQAVYCCAGATPYCETHALTNVSCACRGCSVHDETRRLAGKAVQIMTLDEYMLALRSKRRKLQCPRWDIRVCCSPWWHRKYWYYAGGGRFYCEICEKLAYIA